MPFNNNNLLKSAYVKSSNVKSASVVVPSITHKQSKTTAGKISIQFRPMPSILVAVKQEPPQQQESTSTPLSTASLLASLFPPPTPTETLQSLHAGY